MDGSTAVLLLILIVVGSGLVAGVVARWLLPGPDPMSLPKTILYGMGGSVIGAAAFNLVSRGIPLPDGVRIFFSIGGAALLIWFFRRRR